MKPKRNEKIGRHIVEEFYWNGKMIIYIDNHISDLSWEKAIKACRESQWQTGHKQDKAHI